MSSNKWVIDRYWKRDKTYVPYVEFFSRRVSGCSLKEANFKFNFMSGLFSIQPHSIFFFKRAPMCLFSLKGILQFISIMSANKSKVVYPAHQKDEKISDLTAEKSRLCIWFFRGKENYAYGCHYLPFVSVREIKNSKKKARSNFLKNHVIFPPSLSVIMM